MTKREGRLDRRRDMTDPARPVTVTHWLTPPPEKHPPRKHQPAKPQPETQKNPQPGKT